MSTTNAVEVFRALYVSLVHKMGCRTIQIAVIPDTRPLVVQAADRLLAYLKGGLPPKTPLIPDGWVWHDVPAGEPAERALETLVHLVWSQITAATHLPDPEGDATEAEVEAWWAGERARALAAVDRWMPEILERVVDAML